MQKLKEDSDGHEQSLGEIAAKDLRKAQIFKKYGLDFCCGGRKTVKQACAEKGLDETKIEQELQLADQNPMTRPLSYGDWSPGFLADYIVNTHHSYVQKTLPDLRAYAAKVARVHGSQHPELTDVQKLVEEVNSELTSHMHKEEVVLFPYIKDLVAAANNEKPFQAVHFGTVQNPITLMEAEHEMVGRNMAEIRMLTNNYALTEDACGSWSLLYRMLDEFENDLHIHIHLENNILFPKALTLEKQLNQ